MPLARLAYNTGLIMTYSDDSTARTFPAMVGYGATLASILGIFEYTGGTLWGYNTANPAVDEFERREQLRKAYRKPAEETFAELGEGRGMIPRCSF